MDKTQHQYRGKLTKLSTELSVLNEFVKQRVHNHKKDELNPEYLRMVSPPYERELLAVTRIRKYLKHIYDGTL